ncbi:thioredoxin domain-containing protein 3 homolog [Papilio machaon]|uniref:thioredoxin domain-containing protein 3 homolog n=1 Tax=Papilio machaon TaxID=76193 RepID=UPI001E663FF6|nr:thioredoxin domain-containing protein 3 homolog [Papilio machaon]
MSLSPAVAHHAASGGSVTGPAGTGGAGKKAAQVQLQADLNNDDDWNKFLQRDGLLVIDVYSEWCGPCLGMVGNLKKIKVELGGDNLHLAVAKSDTIECLKRFRHRSEPTWLFIAAGQLLNVVFGADAPRLARTIEQELRNEELARRGERERPRRAPHELTPPEQEAADLQAKQVAERRQREAEAREAARAARREERATRLERHFADLCAALLMPHAQKHLRKVAEALEPYGIAVADKCPLVLGQQGARALAAEAEEMGSAGVSAVLAERPALALLLKKLPDKEGDVIELTRRALYGEGLELEEGAQKKFLAQELCADDLPGLYAPQDRHQRAALLDLLFPKMVGAVVEPPVSAEPPHVALVFGAWQRRAVLAAADRSAPLLLRYGFFADANVQEPKLLCKTIEQYEERTEKDYCETIVLMMAVGVADPLLADPAAPTPDGPPPDLIALGPLHVSADTVVGELECARFFPPGYSQPQPKPKVKAKKKKKKRQEVKDEDDAVPEAAEDAEVNGEDDGRRETEDGEGEGEAEGEAEGEGEEAEGDEAEEDQALVADKATSPPPVAI